MDRLNSLALNLLGTVGHPLYSRALKNRRSLLALDWLLRHSNTELLVIEMRAEAHRRVECSRSRNRAETRGDLVTFVF